MCYIISHWDAFWLCYNLGFEGLAEIPRTGGSLVEEAAYSSKDLDAYDLSIYAPLLAPPAWLLDDETDTLARRGEPSGGSALAVKQASARLTVAKRSGSRPAAAGRAAAGKVAAPKMAMGLVTGPSPTAAGPAKSAVADRLSRTANPTRLAPPAKAAYSAASARPHDVLVPHKAGGGFGGAYLRHRWDGDLPEGALLDLGGGVYTSSPELCVLQLAGDLDDVQLVRYAMALCAEYRTGREKVERHPAITSLARIERLLDGCSSRRGVVRCRRLMRLARDGSRSPKETELHLLLTLPAEMGGYGLVGDELNHQVKFEAEDADILDRPDRRFAYVDLAWPSCEVGVEYQGRDHDDRVPEDRRRINLLVAKGWRMFQSDAEQLGDPARLDVTARQMAHVLGRPVPEKTEAWKAARGELRETLLGPRNVRV